MRFFLLSSGIPHILKLANPLEMVQEATGTSGVCLNELERRKGDVFGCSMLAVCKGIRKQLRSSVGKELIQYLRLLQPWVVRVSRGSD